MSQNREGRCRRFIQLHHASNAFGMALDPPMPASAIRRRLSGFFQITTEPLENVCRTLKTVNLLAIIARRRM
jgi:hypothetical protein